MKISDEYPPNIEEIRSVLTPPESAMFCYGDTIHNPSKNPIDLALMVHEGTHQIQQDGKPKEWWGRYLKEPEFRFKQELEAYRTQYRVYEQTIKNRDQLALRVHNMAKDLSGAMYGNIISYPQAVKSIRGIIQ